MADLTAAVRCSSIPQVDSVGNLVCHALLPGLLRGRGLQREEQVRHYDNCTALSGPVWYPFFL